MSCTGSTLPPAYPGLQRERRTRSLGGEAASSGGRRSYLPAEDGAGRAGERRGPPQEPAGGEGRWEGISRGALRGLSGTAFPSPEDPRLLPGKVYFGGGGRERKGRGYSHGLQGFAEPGFQRLEVFYDHFNHHPERPGPPASPAAAAATTTAAAGSAPPRRPAPRLPPRFLSPAEAAVASRFGRGRLAGAGGPAPRRGRNQPSGGCSLRAPLSPLLGRGARSARSAVRPSVPPPASGAGGGQRGRRARRPAGPERGSETHRPPPRPQLPLAAEPDGASGRAGKMAAPRCRENKESREDGRRAGAAGRRGRAGPGGAVRRWRCCC